MQGALHHEQQRGRGERGGRIEGSVPVYERSVRPPRIPRFLLWGLEESSTDQLTVLGCSGSGSGSDSESSSDSLIAGYRGLMGK